MYQKFFYTLEILILSTMIFVGGYMLSLTTGKDYPSSDSIFELQEKYGLKLKNNIEDLLEQLAGAGNVRASVQLFLKNATQTTTNKKRTQNGEITTTESSHAVLLNKQHISVLINQVNQISPRTYRDIVQTAVGLNTQQGDTLSVQVLPFYQVPFLTFGFSRLTLIRLAGGLGITFFVLVILLSVLYFKEQAASVELKQDFPSFQPIQQKDLTWSFVENLSTREIQILLGYISKNTLAKALHVAPLKIHRLLSESVPPAIWSNILELYHSLPFSIDSGIRARQEIESTLKKLQNEKIL